MDPILYWHFGSAYISGAANENKWLVFFAGPYGFTEDFSAGTPAHDAQRRMERTSAGNKFSSCILCMPENGLGNESKYQVFFR